MWYFVLAFAIFLLALKIYNFLDGRHLLLDLWDEFKLSKLTLLQCDQYCNSNDVKSDIVICFTTIPSRLPFIEMTLKSLLTQSRKPMQIRLHLPKYSKREDCEYEIPNELLNLNNLEIIRCDDFGPATKIIPALEHFEEYQKLIIVDDDMVYPKEMLNHFHEASANQENVALGNSGWIVPNDLICHFVTLSMNINNAPPMPFKATRVRKSTEIDILQGYSGYLIQPSYFDLKEVMNYLDAPEAAFYVDDVLISAHCKVDKFVTPFNRFCSHPKLLKKHFVKSSLAMFNRGGGDPEKRNNSVMIKYFKDRWIGQFD